MKSFTGSRRMVICSQHHRHSRLPWT
jgi:hypothetical protein